MICGLRARGPPFQGDEAHTCLCWPLSPGHFLLWAPPSQVITLTHQARPEALPPGKAGLTGNRGEAKLPRAGHTSAAPPLSLILTTRKAPPTVSLSYSSRQAVR